MVAGQPWQVIGKGADRSAVASSAPRSPRSVLEKNADVASPRRALFVATCGTFHYEGPS
jgi:hypothetical protein